jgi:adenylate kinase
MIFVLFGPPGSGKGTQSQYLVDECGFKHVSTGNLLREEIQAQTPLGVSIKDTMDSGGFISDEIVIKLVNKILDEGANNHIIFDGFPRTVNQALAFDDLLSVRKLKVNLVINFDVDFDKLVERITGRFSCAQCGAVYHKKYQPVKVEGVCDRCGGSEFVMRKDDQPDVVKRRIQVYQNETEAVRKYYEQKPQVLVSIDASESPELVKQSLMKKLAQVGVEL